MCLRVMPLKEDLFDRLVQFNDVRLSVDYVYDALGRRLSKNSYAHHRKRSEAGSQWNRNEQARKQRELGCAFTLYGWDGDTLAWESNPARPDGSTGRTVGNPPFLAFTQNRGQATRANFCLGVMPPRAIFGRS